MIRRIADELKLIDYKGGVVFCGYGEPLLHPELINLCRAFDPKTRLEIVTNGDRLTSEMVLDLQAAPGDEGGFDFVSARLARDEEAHYDDGHVMLVRI